MRFGDLEFDPEIGKSMEKGKLVIFIGAGVSMGPPANMPSFSKLAEMISGDESGKINEPVEHFLDVLSRTGINVHQRAAEILDTKGKKPNSLHLDLLRVFGVAQKVRIVTTNFDLFLEIAAHELWSALPEVFTAPALPRGSDFTGIVHIHGSTKKPPEMVLTDTDYGKAYITEDWAKRFLMELFYNNTVLFVGYSHEDRIMQYLSQGLSAVRIGKRFGLTEVSNSSRWEALGIQPIPFHQNDGSSDYSALIDGIRMFASHYSTGMTEWQSKIKELSLADPGRDPDIGEQALTLLLDPSLARIFSMYTDEPRWLIWLNQREALDALFTANPLTKEQDILARWIAEKFIVQHPSIVIQLLAQHNGKINLTFWCYICRELTHESSCLLDFHFKRYLFLLLDNIPYGLPHYYVSQLAEQCEKRGNIAGLLQCFLAMCAYDASFKCYSLPILANDDADNVPNLEVIFKTDHYHLDKIWRLLESHLPMVCERLISDFFRRLVNVYEIYVNWNPKNKSTDPISWHRNAVDPNIRGRYRQVSIDVIINVILDALKWMCEHEIEKAEYWIKSFLDSNVPILVRIAIFVMGNRFDLSADHLLRWLLEHIDICDYGIRPELYSYINNNYYSASAEVRSIIISRFLSHKEAGNEDHTAEELTDRWHFDRLSWLCKSDPICPYAKKLLAELQNKYPRWQLPIHQDVIWHMKVDLHTPTSPCSEEELLRKDPKQELTKWLNYRELSFDGPSRRGLLQEIKNACKKESAWGISLFRALIDGSHWDSDLVETVIEAWYEKVLSNDEWGSILPLLSAPELLMSQNRRLAHLIRFYEPITSLDENVFDDLVSFTRILWPYAVMDTDGIADGDWLYRSISHPAGNLVEFWLKCLNRIFALSEPNREQLLQEDFKWLSNIASYNMVDAYTHCLFAYYLDTLVALNIPWVEKHVLSLFISQEDDLYQPVWDGFLLCGVHSLPVVEIMMSAFSYLLNHISSLSISCKERFAGLLVSLAFNDFDAKDMIDRFFQRADSSGKGALFVALEELLESSDIGQIEHQWDKWISKLLHRYSYGGYGEPGKISVAALIRCLPHLNHFYPYAINEIISISISDELDNIYLGGLEDSNLIMQYPEATAQLLIFLVPRLPEYDHHLISDIIKRLKEISDSLCSQLNEAMLRKGWYQCLPDNNDNI